METPEQCEKSKFKVNNKDIKTTLVSCPGVFIVNFEQISRIVLLFQSLLWTSKCWIVKYVFKIL